MKTYKYPYYRYNEYDVLKVNWLTIFAILFMNRHILGISIVGMAFSRGGGINTRGALNALIDPVFMLADIPAFLVVLAMITRHPKGGAMVRAIWRHARFFILMSTILYFLLLVYSFGLSLEFYNVYVCVSMVGAISATLYVFLSRYARDVFRDFPERQIEERKNR